MENTDLKETSLNEPESIFALQKEIAKRVEEDISVNRKIYLTNKEILWANIFNNAIKGCEWLEGVSFCPGRWALGYPALYALYRILRDFRPTSILELGLGESTKMIGSYVKNYEDKVEDIKHIVTEHDLNWIRTFTKSFELSDKTIIRKFDIENIFFDFDGEEIWCGVYRDFADIIGNGRKYDFICIDAPIAYTGQKVNRIDVLSILPECLKDDFVIMVDDYNRDGEKRMASILLSILEDAGIQYVAGLYEGEKETLLIASKNLEFLTTL